ncbi:type I secretion C-terminal target domain-containing protein, partial [Aeromonas diversa]|uniref:type I secretion C-terminal target domain-containing protein n=1 Tax=Aeromonas diversa TaxID=502790 RepID=UPI0034621C6B
VVLVDEDGDSTNDSLDVTVQDDVPTAYADVNDVGEGGEVTGNVLTDGQDDVFGADGEPVGGGVIGVRAADGDLTTAASGNLGVSIPGAYGNLILYADGSYTYQATADVVPPPAVDVFVYSITDQDGDISTTTLSITLNNVEILTSADDGMVYEAGLPTGSDADADSEIANGQLNASGGTGPYTYSLLSSGSGGFGTLLLNPDGSYTYTLESPYDTNPAINDGNNVEENRDSFTYQVMDANGNTATGTLYIDIVDDVPQFNSVMDAVLSSHTHVAFDGRYDANFGADGLDYLSVALAGSGLYGGSAVTFVQGAPDVDGVVRVDVTNGLNVVLFSFYYETTTSAASDGGDGTVSFNAFTNPLDPDHSQFFTLTVNPDGTYTFDMISNTVISTTTVDGEDFTAFGPTYSVYTADGVPGTSDLPSLIIYGSDGDGVTDADDQVNASSQGIGVKTPTIGSGESLTFDFEKDQSYVKFSLQQFSGGGSATFMILLDGAVFDFYPLLAADGLTITKPSSGDAWVEVIVTENVGLIGTWAQTGTAAEPVYTLYVGTQFDDLKLEHDAGSLKFNVNHITYDQTIAVEDLQLNFNLAATDLDGDKAVLGDQLTVMMLDPSEPVAATAVGADANDGVVLVGNGEADVITGGTGNDILIGESDNDQLYGGGGNDLLDGGSGNDLLDGGTGSDTASYMDAGAGVTVDLNIVGAQNTVGAGQDTLVSIENLTGSDYDDILTGDDGDNVLIGGGGQDTLTGNDGSDTFKWDSGDASAGVDVIQDFQVGLGGDVLDISELLSGASDNATALEQYLTFSQGPGGSTTLVIDIDGVAGGTTQTIQFDSLDLTAGGTLSNHDIIQSLLDTENLKVVGP